MKALMILCTIFTLILLSIINNISVIYPLLGGLLITSIYGVVEGHKVKTLIKMSLDGVKRSSIIYILFVLIGSVISVWIASGTMPVIMYYGFILIHPRTFIITAFILTSAVSMILGTSFGTVSTVGIALMAVGRGFGINPGIIAGAIISGAYLGDRSSPMSSSAVLTSVVTESDIYDNLRHMIGTMIPAFVISAVMFYMAGIVQGNVSPDMNRVLELQNALKDSFNISPLVLVPPLIIMILAVFKVNIKINMFVGIVTGCITAVLLQGTSIMEIIKYIIYGYSRQMPNEFLSSIIKGGGIFSMVKPGLVVAASSALNGVFEGTKIMDKLFVFLTKGIKKPGELVLRSVLISILTAMYGCSQTLSIIMTGYIMKSSYRKFKISNSTFARTIADSCVVLSPLVPWNIAGMVPAVNMGVNVTDFIPYAFLCFTLPVITILYSYLGIIKTETPSGISVS